MECERKDKWWRGCRFEPRYDRIFRRGSIEGWGLTTNVIEAMKDRVYVSDVCIRCGKVIKRGE